MRRMAIKLFFIAVATFTLCFYSDASDEKGGHGKAMLPIVFVVKNEKGVPLAGISVRVEYTKDERDRAEGLKEFTDVEYVDSLTTDANGSTVLFVLAHWFSPDVRKSMKVSYKGSILISGEGFQPVRKKTSDFVGTDELILPAKTAPYTEVLVARKMSDP